MVCCICSDTARRDTSNPSNNLQLFKRPKSVEKYATNGSPFVCSKHFASKYMRAEEGEVWLRADAIPTLALSPITSSNSQQHFKLPILINTLSSRKLEISNGSQSAIEKTPSLSSTSIRDGSNDDNQSSSSTNRCSHNTEPTTSQAATRTIESSLPETERPQWATSLHPEFDDICGEVIWSFATYQDLEMFASLSIDQQNQILSSILSENPEKNRKSFEPSFTDTIKPVELPGSTNNEMGESVIEERARLQRFERSRPTPTRVRQSRQQLIAQLKIKDDQIAHLKRQVRRLKNQIASSGSSIKEEENDDQMNNDARPSVLRLSHYIPVIPAASVRPSSTTNKKPPEEIIIIE